MTIDEIARYHITLLLNANATGDSLDRVTFTSYDRTVHVAQAGIFILAMGAIENARFMLNCTEDVRVSLGNEYGMVGIGFMEHFNVSFGEFVAARMGVADKLQFLTGFDCPGTGAILSLTEQFPSRSSYVELSERVDRFGGRPPRPNWVMTDEDRESIRRIGIQLGKDLADAGLGAIWALLQLDHKQQP